jgi:KDO2-lipid IV(A) lauroyltransferase
MIACMRLVGRLPLAWVRALGWLLGRVLRAAARSRWKVAQTNLALCFPAMPAAERDALTGRLFTVFAQTWLDRAWLWHADAATVARRVRLQGALHEFDGDAPVILFCPHFVGLDAAATVIALQVRRTFTSIYTTQANRVVDEWVRRGRLRFGDVRIFERNVGVREIVASLRAGNALYLLPDMNFGRDGSLFVPFFGVPAATVPSLSRFARLGRAKVVPVLPRLTPDGYRIDVLPAWQDFPTDDLEADTRRMNRCLEEYIATMPEQYFWVHKRFKTRPEGEPPVY